MNNFIAIQWYYNGRDGTASCTTILPELTDIFGPFPDADKAKEWIETADKWGGWGEYKYEIKSLVSPKR